MRCVNAHVGERCAGHGGERAIPQQGWQTAASHFASLLEMSEHKGLDNLEILCRVREGVSSCPGLGS